MVRRTESEVNPYASPETDLTTEGENVRDGNFVYATFSQRFSAAFVDGLITQVIALVFGFALGFGMAALNAHEFVQPASFVLGILVGWLYSALQESSETRATVGKKLMGLQVVDMNGGQISFGQATGRHFAKIISGLILLIGYLMQPFTAKKQALHDIMAGTLVIKANG